MYVFLHLITSSIVWHCSIITTPVKLSFVISLVLCTARPITQPVVSDIRHAKQVPLLTILFAAHGTLALYQGFPLPPKAWG